MDLLQKPVVGQGVTTGAPMYKCIETILRGDAKTKFALQANLVGDYTVGNFTMVMATMTVYIFPVLEYQGQIRFK